MNASRMQALAVAVCLSCASPALAADAGYLPLSQTPVPPKHLMKAVEPESAASYDAAFNGLVGNRRNRAASLDPYTTTSLKPVPSSEYMPKIMMAEASGSTSAQSSREPLAAGAGEPSASFNRRKLPNAIPASGSSGLLGDSYDWAGVYAGVKAGGAFALAKYEPQTAFSLNGFTYDRTSTGNDFKFGGGVGGGFAGANVSLEQFVVGVEFGLMKTSLKNTNKFGELQERSVSLDSLATARTRLGVTRGPVLAFLSFGAGFGKPTFKERATKTTEETDDEGVTTSLTKTEYTTGKSKTVAWMMGAGIDYAFTQNFIGRVEYSFVDFGVLSKSKSFDTGFLTTTETITRKFNMHLIEFAIAYKY